VDSTQLQTANFQVTSTESSSERPTEDEIQSWLIAYLSELLEIDATEFRIDDALASYGLDSSGAVGLAGDLSEWLGIKLEAELLYNYPTIESLARFVATKASR
jgi:acyl carrier protein